jgi:Arc/MetJ-type ribon-helix-helix transcriptional regulator
MVKSTVRFPETVIEQVEEMVKDGTFSSKSEFQRFAVEYVLSETTDYNPEVVDFDAICNEIFPEKSVVQEAEPAADSSNEFVETATRVRQYAVRGEIGTAKEYIDTHYPPTDPRSMLLDDLLIAYQQDNTRDR